MLRVDTTYSNEALIDLKGKHPEFPGASYWHFRKMRESYRHFAGEIIIQKPELLCLKKIGHDLDKALSSGFTDIFRDTKTLYCTQHMQERDAFKLQSVGCNQWSKQKIMADIYGCPSDAPLKVNQRTQTTKTILMSNLKVSKMSGKKQLLLFTNGFEKQGRNNSRIPLSCQPDKVLVSKDTSPPTDWD